MAESPLSDRDPKALVHDLLCSPVVDKIVAWGMALAGLRILFVAVEEKQGLPLLLLVAQGLVHNLLLLVRRKPDRITLSPWFWIVPVAGAHWHLVYAAFRNQPGEVLAAPWFTTTLSFVGASVFVWSRASLGRGFGMVPAKRGGIVDSGLYGIIRHPIYTSSFLMGLSYHLSHFSILTFGIWSIGLVLMVTKAVMEEVFLEGDAEYERYRAKVPNRFFPFEAKLFGDLFARETAFPRFLRKLHLTQSEGAVS